MEKVGVQRGCGVMPVVEGVEAGQERSKVVNKLKVNGGMDQEGERSKKEGSV